MHLHCVLRNVGRKRITKKKRSTSFDCYPNQTESANLLVPRFNTGQILAANTPKPYLPPQEKGAFGLVYRGSHCPPWRSWRLFILYFSFWPLPTMESLFSRLSVAFFFCRYLLWIRPFIGGCSLSNACHDLRNTVFSQMSNWLDRYSSFRNSVF